VSKRFALLCLLAVLALAAPGNASAKPVLLLFHPGGFCFGKPAMMNDAAAYAEPRFQPVKVDYPLCDLSAALRYSINEAKRFPNRKVYAYGESAGGSIAARLGEMKLVQGTAVQDPVANVVKFMKPYEAYFGVDWSDEARWMSPDRHPSRGRIRAWIAQDDSLSPDSWRWARKDPKVVGQGVPGRHLQQPYRTETMHSAIDYLAAH
jgi:acetyl esterase/lipase